MIQPIQEHYSYSLRFTDYDKYTSNKIFVAMY